MTRLGPFATPWALLLLPLAGGVIWLLMRRLRSGGPRIAFPDARGLAGLPTSPWVRIEKALPWLRGGAIVLAVVALARPQAGSSITTVSSNGVDIVIAIDISGSMRCEDTRSKNRLVVAKDSISRFVAGRPDDRIGIVAFGSVATTRCPLTLDHDMLLRFVEELDFAPPGEDRTALGMGLATAVNRMRASKAKSKVVVLVTDGRSNAGQLGPESAAEAARALGFKVYTVGVGSEGEVPCLVDDPRGGRRYVRVQADFDEAGLQKIAETTGARYFRAADADGFAKAFHEIDALEKTEVESRMRILYTEKFGQALVPAGLLLGFELLLAGTRLKRIP
jgi:Ca-activated chloride channel family protein